MKILYVEDEAPHVELTRRTLEDNLKDGFVLYNAESLQAALKILSIESDIDLVLTDLRLPDGSGLDLLKKVKEFPNPPAVVLVTGQGDQEVAVAALKAGAADYLVKQSDYLHRLPVVISNAVAQNRLERGQAALREAEVKYQSLVEQIPAVVFLDAADEAETTLYISPRIEELTGYTPDEWRADLNIWKNLLHPDDRARVLEIEKVYREEGDRFQAEYRLIRKDGRVVWIKEDTNEIRDKNGNLMYLQGILLDITKDKENESALQRQLRELTTLHAVATAEAESTSEDEIITRVTAIISQIYSDVCGILLLDATGNILTPHPSYFGADISSWQNGYPITDGITGRSVSAGKIIRIGNITNEPGYIQIASGVLSELCVPIHVHERVIGVINVESRLADAFTVNDEGFLTTISNGLGTALEKIRLFDEEQRRSKELNTLYLATRSLAESLEPDIIAGKLITIIAEILIYESASIYILDNQNQFLIPLAINQKAPISIAAEGVPESLIYGKRALGQGIIGWVVQHSESIRSGDVSKETRYLPIIKNIRSEMCVPLTARGKVIGAINVETTIYNAYTDRDENLLTALANSAAIALENARLFESEKKRRQEAEALRQAGAVISATLDPDTVAQEILTALKQIIPYDSGSVFLHESDKLRIAAAQGYPQAEQLKNLALPTDDEFFQLIKKTGEPIIIQDAQKDTRFKHWGNTYNIHGWMVVPLISRGRVIGAITLDSVHSGMFDENTGSTAIAFAHQAAAAIDNARLYNETQSRLRELEIINLVSTSLRLAQSIDEMLPILLNEALLLVDTPNGSIWLYDSSSNMLIQRIAKGAEAKLSHKALKPGEGIAGYVFTTGEKYISPELKADALLSTGNKESMTPGLSGIFIPIQSTVGPVGVLVVALKMDRRIAEEINLLTILAELTGNAIHRAELFAQSQEQIHRLTTLRDIDAAIASSTDLRVTLNILMDHSLKHLKTDAVDIMLYHPELQSLTYLSSMGFNNPAPSRPLMRLGEGLAGQVAMKGGIEYVTDLRESNEVKRDPMLIREGFVTYFGIPLIVKGQIKGVFEIFHRAPFTPTSEWMQFLQTLAGQAAIAIDNSQLFEHLQRSNQEVTQAYDTTLEGWARALELRDRETEGHTRRVTELTMQLARHMGISEDELTNIYRGVLLHDIGKMGVPDQILRKTGPLIETEWVEMRMHPEYAFNLLAPIPYLRPALDIPYCHHEHWDGSGYPRGLKGEQIPLAARIFSIVDIWDALLSDRPYRKAWPKDKVIEYLQDVSGKILDPRIVVDFLHMIAKENL